MVLGAWGDKLPNIAEGEEGMGVSPRQNKTNMIILFLIAYLVSHFKIILPIK